MSDNDNKVALVTGASRGIGQAILLALAAKGHTVIGTATTSTGAEKISALLQSKKINGKGMVLDITESSSIQDVVSSVSEAYGAPAILVNNAGITRDNLLLRMKDEEWESIIETDLNSVYRMTKVCVKNMVKARWGRIINITSVVACMGNGGQSNYAAAKAGIIGFSKSLGQELASRNITVNAIAPGFIETDMRAQLTEQQRELIFNNIPMNRMGKPEEVAAAAAFLASAEAAYITGITLHINGGMYMS